MLTNSSGSSFSAAFQFRCSLEGGIDGLDFSDHLDLDEHSLSSMKIEKDTFDEFFHSDSPESEDDSSRDSLQATSLRMPAERPSVVNSSNSLHLSSLHYVNEDAETAFNAEHSPQQYEPMGSTSTHSGPPSLMSNGAAPINSWETRRRKATSQRSQSYTAPVSAFVQELQGPLRRKSTDCVPEYMKEFVARCAQGGNPSSACVLEEFGHQDDHLMSGRIKRRKSQFDLPDVGNEPVAADISIAVREAQEKIFRLKGLLGHNQQELMNTLAAGKNHPQASCYMAYQPARSSNMLASEHGLPWAPSCPPSHFLQQAQQDNLQQVTMAKLQAAMERTNSTMKLLQDWDRAHGLPASHCQTMVNSSRSRKQLKEGVVLKKWNGSPLLNFMRRT